MKKTFVIGDVQGCFSELQQLIRKIGRNHIAQLWFTGDLVNRGANSLEMLRWCVSNRHWIRVVLGNHDLHLLAVAAGVREARPDDTIDAVLKAPDCDNLLNWLRQQPLAYLEKNHLMVHAGLLPQWSAIHALELSNEVSTSLRSAHWKDFFSSMYGNQPAAWNPALRGADRSRVIINAMTRLRFCTENGAMEFETKEGSQATPNGYLPWFAVAGRRAEITTVVFGHWSTLGLTNKANLLGVDTGCVWGGMLTAAEITNSPHRTIVQVAGPNSK